jgi:hypothetical protein
MRAGDGTTGALAKDLDSMLAFAGSNPGIRAGTAA